MPTFSDITPSLPEHAGRAAGRYIRDRRHGEDRLGDIEVTSFKWVRISMWVLSAVALVAGFFIGFNVDAKVGGYLWLASAVLALVPFASHREPK